MVSMLQRKRSTRILGGVPIDMMAEMFVTEPKHEKWFNK